MRRVQTMTLCAVASALLALVARETGTNVRCDVDAKFSCGPRGWEGVAPGTSARIGPERWVYSRCDARGCDDHDALISRSGDFVNVALPEHGMLAKLSLSDGGFVEVATLGTAALVSYGRCRTD
jgi:hypothetical protein